MQARKYVRNTNKPFHLLIYQSIDINHNEDSQSKRAKKHEKNVKGVYESRVILSTFIPIKDKYK